MTRPGLKLASILLSATIVACFSSCTSSNAENRNLIINGAVHVYSSDTPPPVYPGPEFIEVLGPKDKVKVQRVEYKNGYMAVQVKLKDGRQGWVFSGESIELK